ncbi:hypothetical protein JTE90_017124 [Oedothorax gibbosus]|uniref:RRM domain-containing protein n=1 Tax=Oedothorax gibbosus TaxID=931172 RepID=A0AAV6UEK9_9ARAC|nr:hypothetical protein JTE90_017124 [Oedothorax gibbosus]
MAKLTQKKFSSKAEDNEIWYKSRAANLSYASYAINIFQFIMEYKISIENLYPHVYVSQLCQVFQKYGNILSARVEVNKTSVPSHKGYVSFDNLSSAQYAVKEMNGMSFIGKPMVVKMDLPGKSHYKISDSKIFVKNFDTNWDDCDFYKVFSKFGDVAEAKVFEVNGKSKGSGFVEFANHSSAKAAIKAMHNQLINNKKLIVEPYQIKEVVGPLPPTLEKAKELLEKSVQLNNLHVKNLPKEMTERELEVLFQPFGEIQSAIIKRDNSLVSKGFGFVCFTNAKDAELAKEKMNKCTYKSMVLEVNFNQKKEARQQYLRMVNTGGNVRKFNKEEESLPVYSNKNTLLSFSGKKKY